MNKTKNMGKRLLAVILVGVLCLTVIGCNKVENQKEPEPTKVQQQQKEETNLEKMPTEEITPTIEGFVEPTDDPNTKDNNSKEIPTDTSTSIAKGRYIENGKSLEEWLREEHPEERLINVIEEEGNLNIYTVLDDKTVIKYELIPGQPVVRSEPKWINSKPGNPWRVFRGQDGKIYSAKLVNMKGIELTVSESEEKGTKVPMSGSSVIIAEVLKNGDIITESNGGSDLVLYSGSTGKVKCHIPMGLTFTAVGEYIAVVDTSATNLILYNTEGEKVHNIPVEGASEGSVLIQGHAEDIYLITNNGIFRTGINGTIWEGIIDGKLNTIGSPTSVYQQLEVTETGDFYLIMNAKQDGFFEYVEKAVNVLYQYSYDSETDSVPQQQLVIYGLKENPTIRQAAAGFQGRHPEVMISYIVADTGIGTITTEDYIRTLNMELMGGKGPDILILDGLPADQYIRKGILSPLDSILEQEKDTLLPNIGKTLQTEDGCYGIPLRLTLPLMLIGKGMEEYASSLEQLAAYAKENKGASSFTFKDEQELISSLYEVYNISLLEGEKVNKEKLTSFLENLKIISENQISNPDQKKGKVLLGANLVSAVPLEFTGFDSLQQPFTAIEEAKGGYLQLTGSVNANSTLAINAASSNISLAKKFIQECLSYEVQRYDLNDGFPVNQKAMDYLKNLRTMDSFGGDFIFHGKEYYMSIADIGLAKTEELVQLIQILPITVKQTDVFKDILYSESTLYLKGERTLNETVQNIAVKAELSLME